MQASPNPGFFHCSNGNSLVIGLIVAVHIDDDHLKDSRIDRNSLDLIGRMGGTQYTRTTERIELERPKV